MKFVRVVFFCGKVVVFFGLGEFGILMDEVCKRGDGYSGNVFLVIEKFGFIVGVVVVNSDDGVYFVGVCFFGKSYVCKVRDFVF